MVILELNYGYLTVFYEDVRRTDSVQQIFNSVVTEVPVPSVKYIHEDGRRPFIETFYF